MLQLLADRIILCPSRNEIRVEHKRRQSLKHDLGEVEVWTQRRSRNGSGGHHVGGPHLSILKFGGGGSPAERATIFPLDFWDDASAEIWAPNWPGFGTSAGRASVRYLAEVGAYCYEEVQRAAAGRPVVVTGNSLGTAIALFVAAKFRDMNAIVLRNPPPLRQLITGKHGWYSAWVGAWLISRCVPPSLDSIQNARGSDVPALFVTSGKDRVVPPVFQDRVFDAYAGPKRRMLLPQADHADFPHENDIPGLREHLQWLRQRGGLAAGTPAGA